MKFLTAARYRLSRDSDGGTEQLAHGVAAPGVLRGAYCGGSSLRSARKVHELWVRTRNRSQRAAG
jgi:hypothetical protein